MKRKINVISAAILLVMSMLPLLANAQTLLPGVEDVSICAKLLTEYELTGAIPLTDQEKGDKQKADEKLQDSEKKLNEAKQKINDLGKKYKDSGCVGHAYDEGNTECYKLLGENVDAKGALEDAQREYDNAKYTSDQVTNRVTSVHTQLGDLLGCAIKTGRISLNMLPYFIKYIADFALGLSGLIAVLFIVIGGYFYVWGGLTDNKEKGKKTIINALIGMSVAILSWTIVSLVLAVFTT